MVKKKIKQINIKKHNSIGGRKWGQETYIYKSKSEVMDLLDMGCNRDAIRNIKEIKGLRSRGRGLDLHLQWHVCFFNHSFSFQHPCLPFSSSGSPPDPPYYVVYLIIRWHQKKKKKKAQCVYMQHSFQQWYIGNLSDCCTLTEWQNGNLSGTRNLTRFVHLSCLRLLLSVPFSSSIDSRTNFVRVRIFNLLKIIFNTLKF